MITLYGFGRVNPLVIGETRDLRAQWALEEMGLPYQVKGLDHTAGELESDAYTRVNCFRLLPAIDDDGFIVSESAAVLLYLAEKSGKLIPRDFKGRTQVVQWCFAALNTVERPLSEILMMSMAPDSEDVRKRRAEMVEQLDRWFTGLERRLQGREWIAADDFTVADILLANVLREVRKTELMEPYPLVRDYYDRALARPAWKRTLNQYAERLGVKAADIA